MASGYSASGLPTAAGLGVSWPTQSPGYDPRSFQAAIDAIGGGMAADYAPAPAAGGYDDPSASPAPSAVPMPATTEPQGALGQSPAYLAFLRSLGLSDATDMAGNQLAIDALNRRAGLALENNAASGAQARQGIADNYETRGLFRSGARLRSQAAQQEGEARQQAGVINDTADQTAALVAELAQRRAARQQDLAEKSYTTAGDVYAAAP